MAFFFGLRPSRFSVLEMLTLMHPSCRDRYVLKKSEMLSGCRGVEVLSGQRGEEEERWPRSRYILVGVETSVSGRGEDKLQAEVHLVGILKWENHVL